MYKPFIYIASPYSIGNKLANTYRQIHVAHKLIDMDFVPVVPLLSHFLDEYQSRTEKLWLDIDFRTISRCDGLLRLPGKSYGADLEVKHAIKLSIPVFISMNELLTYYRVWDKYYEIMYDELCYTPID